MDEGGGEGYPFKNHASTMYKQEICVLTTVFMNVPTSWTYFMQARKTNTSESNHETSNKKTAQCNTFKIGIR